MAVRAGTRFGPYEILETIGAGAMGEVHRARDTRLGRDVAIKTLPPGLSSDPERLRRFELEARAASLLSHPNILTVFDVGTTDGQPYIVSELLEGENLRERLNKGALPPRRVAETGVAIAGALAAAHARGIVHRDLKPENLFLTRDGRIKILDFGVAKLTHPDHEKPAGADTATILTDVGVAVGTLGYMAPEQMRGEPVDHRADIFAFGAILHEMVAGVPAFRQDSRIATVNAALESDPPALPEGVPPAIRRLIGRCLEKNPADRFQSARDLAFSLSALSDDSPAAESTGRTARPPKIDLRIAGIVALLAVAAVAAVAAALWPRTPVSAPRIVRSALTLAPDVTAAIDYGAVAFAPDGASVVYVGRKDGKGQLYLRRLHESDDTPISGTENADMPFFSPDGQWVGFATPGYLKKIPIDGGSPTIICSIQSYFGASWAEDGTIVFSHLPETGIFRVPASGGTPEVLTTLASDDHGDDHRYPQMLPGNRAVLYAVATGPEESARIVVSDLRTGTRKEIVRGAASARFVAPDQIVYARGAELFALPFNVDRLDTTGPPRRIAASVAEGTDGAPEYSFSASGDLVYVSGTSGGWHHRLAFVDLQGHLSPINVPPMESQRPRISPDGRFIAFYIGAAKNNIWAFDRERDLAARVTFGRFHDPVWRPDGHLTMAEGGPGAKRMVTRSVDGGGGSNPLTEKGPDHFPESWSPDGRALVYRMMQPEGHWDLWSFSASDKPPRPLVATPFNELNARFSPDGRWLAYSSDENGRPEIYVRSVEDNGGRWPVSTSGGFLAAWAPDGRRIYYSAPDGMWTADVADGPRFVVGRPRQLFSMSGFAREFDITPDGRRFVMVQLDTTPPPGQLQLVLNLLGRPRD